MINTRSRQKQTARKAAIATPTYSASYRVVTVPLPALLGGSVVSLATRTFSEVTGALVTETKLNVVFARSRRTGTKKTEKVGAVKRSARHKGLRTACDVRPFFKAQHTAYHYAAGKQ